MPPKAKKQKVEKVDMSGILLGMGNPLLDMSAEVPASMLEKYGLKPADAILAEEKHLPLYEELPKDYEVTYTAGGATQNSIRVCQWMLQVPKATGFIGSVGKDKNGKMLEKCATKDKVHVYYHKDTEPTGTCACLIVDKERSLVTNLKAANNYKIDHLKTKAMQKVVEKAKFYYSAGFFLTVSPESIMHVAEHAHEHKKTMIMNLSAPFICEYFKEPQLKAIPYCDIIIGNEAEAAAFAKANDLKDSSPEAVCKHLAAMEKKNPDRPRMAIVTQGPNPVIVCVGDKVQKFKVPPVPKEDIVDSNGAGDAFVGGFLAMLIQGKDIKECVQAGNYASRTILQVSGTVLSGKPAKPEEWLPCEEA